MGLAEPVGKGGRVVWAVVKVGAPKGWGVTVAVTREEQVAHTVGEVLGSAEAKAESEVAGAATPAARQAATRAEMAAREGEVEVAVVLEVALAPATVGELHCRNLHPSRTRGGSGRAC